MTRKSKVRYNRFRTYRLKVSPTTRAIRSAILGLAVAGTVIPAAQAGTCTFQAPNSYYCDGVFNNTINYAIDDVTVVVGSNPFAVVTPGAGSDGIHITDNAGGYVNVITDSAAAILVSYADGIFVGADDVSVDSSSTILSYYGNGIDTYSVYDTTVVSGGAISVLDAGFVGSGYDLDGIYSYAQGNVSITQGITGSITALTTYGPGAASTGIEAVARGNTYVGVNGAITAITSEGTSTGVRAYSLGSATVNLASTADISAVVGDTLGYSAYGVLATSLGLNAYINNNGGDVQARTYGYNRVAYGLSAHGYYYAHVYNGGNVHVRHRDRARRDRLLERRHRGPVQLRQHGRARHGGGLRLSVPRRHGDRARRERFRLPRRQRVQPRRDLCRRQCRQVRRRHRGRNHREQRHRQRLPVQRHRGPCRAPAART